MSYGIMPKENKDDEDNEVNEDDEDDNNNAFFIYIIIGIVNIDFHPAHVSIVEDSPPFIEDVHQSNDVNGISDARIPPFQMWMER